MKILFMGTPEFAVPSLEALIDAGYELCGVFCQPDRPVGRHQNKLQAPPVKECALAHNIPVFQPTKLRDGTAFAQVQELAPDLIVVAAYGRILPKEILDYPRLGCINVHSSLLPKYRGAAPINWAILNGEKETGVTIMHMAEALDAGDIIAQTKISILPTENTAELTARLAECSGSLLVETISAIENGSASRIPQKEEAVTWAPMLSKDMSVMDFSRSAQELHNQVCGLYPWPSAVATVAGIRCKILRTEPDNGCGEIGTVLEAGKKGLLVACGNRSALRILELQPDGKKPMATVNFLQGHPLKEGDKL